ncbi:hypothetical protein ACWDUN_04025 [Mycobacterium sp. NPDC003323]
MQRKDWWVPGLYLDEAGYYQFDGAPMDAELFTQACSDVGRNEGPALLLDLYNAGAIEIWNHPAVVVDVWAMCEFPATRFDPPTIWVELFEEAGFTHDGQPADRPEQPVTLYRGCHPGRRFGMSWTTDTGQARWFAQRDLGQGVGDVYTVSADPSWLLAYIGDEHRQESEYVIDPAYLNDGVVSQLRTPPIAAG